MSSNSFFEVEKGLQIGSAVFLSGAGAPGGAGDPDLVGLGSFYLDTTNGQIYLKDTAGTGVDKWDTLSTSTYVDSQVTAGGSWREPVEAIEDTLTATPAAATNTIDGETIVTGMRVLFTNLTTPTDRNVWVATGTTGAWTWTEDVQEETSGDTIFVYNGSHAGQTWVYNGTDWIHTASTSDDELGFLRSFIGKGAAGSESPSYASALVVTQNANLETAIGELDVVVDGNTTDIGTNAGAITNLQNEDGFIRTFVGKSAAGSETPTYTSNGYISNGDTLEAAIGKLDNQIGINVGNINANASEIAQARTETQALNVTTLTTVDSVNCDVTAAVKWMVYVQGNLVGDAAKKFCIEVFATHDGHNVSGGADATQADDTQYAKLKVGNLSGLDISIDVSGAGAAQVMNLKVVSTDAVDVRAVREVIDF